MGVSREGVGVSREGGEGVILIRVGVCAGEGVLGEG